MRVLSATDAIQPAWNHARRMVVAPRKWGLAFKLTALGFFARMGGCNSNFHRSGSNMHHLPPSVAMLATGVMLLLGIIFLIIGLVLFYVGSRLQFVLFDSVLRSDTQLAPVWRRFGRATWYWIGLKLAYFVVAILCCLPFLLPAIIGFLRAVRSGGTQHNPAAFLTTFLGFFAGMLAAVILISIGYVLLSDFGLPSMALEGTTLGETVSRIVRLCRAEPGPVLLYMLIRFVLSIAASLCGVMAMVIAMLVAAIPLGGLGAIAWFAMHNGGLPTHVLMWTLIVLLASAFAALAVIVAIMLFGYIQVFFQAYAVYFLAGRYPLMGQMLESTVPPQIAAWLQPYPVMPSPVPPTAPL